MSVNNKNWVLITGGSKGIGYEIAKLLAPSYNLYLAARSEESLKEAKSSLSSTNKVQTIACDLSKKSGVELLKSSINTDTLEILINNAGFGGVGPFAKQSIDSQLNMIDLNIKGLTSLSHWFFTINNNCKKHLVQLSSMASFLPGPNHAVYYATKAYVQSLSEALFVEGKSKGIAVTSICPGPVQTEFISRAKAQNLKTFKYARSPEFIAKATLKAIKKNKKVVIVGRENLLLYAVMKLTPKSLLLKISELSKN